MQKSVQDNVQDNGNPGDVFVGEYKPHLKMNLIQMTLPDKPNSRNQRYIKI
ncbi:Fic family protein [Blautia wexlerae]|uniref:Fic family protein n=1 Tax=Blautia wexlerae TaxID=418240 RepID=UPI002FE6F607